MVIITRGKDPTIVAEFTPEKEPSVTEYAVITVEDALIKDTNGAGDSFAGGFLGEIALGHSISKAVETGHFWAAKIIQRVGFSLE